MNKIDKVLIIALVLGLILSLHGINWGRYESWNPDQMVFRKLFKEGQLPFNPETFQKPPFHTYFNYFLAHLPIKIIGKVLSPPLYNPIFVKLIWSRIITILLFLGSITLVYLISRKYSSVFSARIITAIFSTSAGFIGFNHFLTTDIPVMFWMLVVFYFCQKISTNGKLSDYVSAGFFTGIATATKYNGLAIGIVIPVAHLLSLEGISLRKIFFNRKIIIGLVMVAIGFVVGNPFAIIDYERFISDFLYLNIVASAYDEAASGHSYLKFFQNFPELIGFPSFIIFFIGIFYSLYLSFTKKIGILEKKTLVLLLSVFLIYFLKFGAFPRLPTRFVLPILPFWLLLSGPFLNHFKNKRVIIGIFTAIICYNLICSFYVGKRFLEDPRMIAQEWVKDNISNGSSIESTVYCPSWNNIPGVKIKAKRIPFITGRKKLFEKSFEGNKWVMENLKIVEGSDTGENWYSTEQLKSRQPDYIAIDSVYYSRFFRPPVNALYPSITEYFRALLAEEYPYLILFDRETDRPPVWIYPKEIDFLHNRLTILYRK